MAQNHFGAWTGKRVPNVKGQGACAGKEEQVPFSKSCFYFANTGMMMYALGIFGLLCFAENARCSALVFIHVCFAKLVF